jgi:proteic killer suppression protein
LNVIKNWKSQVLKDLFETGKARRMDTVLQKRCLQRLTVLNEARDTRDLNLPGFEFHPWKGWKNKWSISVSGQWRITFAWTNGDAYDVDLEQPH